MVRSYTEVVAAVEVCGTRRPRCWRRLQWQRYRGTTRPDRNTWHAARCPPGPVACLAPPLPVTRWCVPRLVPTRRPAVTITTTSITSHHRQRHRRCRRQRRRRPCFRASTGNIRGPPIGCTRTWWPARWAAPFRRWWLQHSRRCSKCRATMCDSKKMERKIRQSRRRRSLKKMK